MKRLTTILTLFLAIGTYAIAQSSDWSRSHGRGYLGIYSEQISKEKAKILGFDNLYGSYVTKVIKNSAAETAGIQPFDYIYAINEDETSYTKELTSLLENYAPNDKVTIRFIRDGKKKSLEMALGKQSKEPVIAGEKAFLGVSPYGDDSDEELGVKVYIVDNSTAEAMEMQDGDVITAINGHKIVDWGDITTAINMLKVGEKIAIDYQRNEKPMHAEMPLKSYEESKKRQVTVTRYTPDSWAYLGIYSNTISESKAEKLKFDNPYGSYITRVLPNSAAEKAGLEPFDYVYGIDDYRTNESENLTKILKRFQPDDKATLYFIRNGQKKTMPIIFGKRSESETSIVTTECDSPLLGVRQNGSYSEGKGISVEIVQKSTAEEMGMQDGDMITKINDHLIIDWDDISASIDNMTVGETVTVEFLRNGKVQTASKAIKSYCDTHTEDGYDFINRSEEKDDTPIWDVSVANAIIDLKDMTEAEMEEISSRFSIQMPKANNLNVSNLSIIPDAKTGKYQLQFNLPQEGETSVNVYNAAGRLIYNYDLGTFKGDFNDQVDISQNGIGSYYLEIRQGNKALAKKILLQTR
ncbi:MAG: PDZ domain-containing protein [Saprospiraceae bacterium]|nr:PDZ domain-containing protein [Saprospiraceae bacterium]